MRNTRRIALVVCLVPLLIVAALVSAGAQDRRPAAAQSEECGTPTTDSSASQPLRGDADRTVANDRIPGGGGSDGILGLKGNDCLSGGDGADTLVGGAGNDDLFGDASRDDLSGGDGNDTLDGGAEDDHLTDNSGKNELNGNDGNDVIDAGNQAAAGLEKPDKSSVVETKADTGSTLSGGDGDDSIYAANGVPDTVDCGSGVDMAVGDEVDTFIDCEYVLKIKDSRNFILIKKPGSE
jgi:Ca2+-binding RTX toxin-like protein